jgi:subtilase family serine protease
MAGSVPALARGEFDVGRSPSDLPMNRMILVLSRRPGAERDLDELLAAQQNPLSADYHRWLSPQEFGKRFGLADQALSDVTRWLSEEGFVVDEVPAGRGWINFSGNAGEVERAFQTEIHDFWVGGELHRSNLNEPSIPRRLAGSIASIHSLNDFRKQPLYANARKLSGIGPSFNSDSGEHFLAPGDFSTIYNTNPLYAAGTDGSGESIAIVGRSEIALGDVQYFRTLFALPPNDPVFINNGPSPGDVLGDDTEALLDVEWSGAVAPAATVNFVISASTATTDGVDLSAQYIVEHNLSPVMSTSFGLCESLLGPAANFFYINLWSQAAAQGITSFVSSGDSGAAGCNPTFDLVGSGRAVSGLSSTAYNVCVGGTQFDDLENPSTYWAGHMDSSTKTSALSYIPESAWNESALFPGGSGIIATGGGKSDVSPKPWWQAAPGVPNDGQRDVPDVSLSAALHDGYLIIQGHSDTDKGLFAISGTSASTPSMAGILALVVQAAGSRQGNANAVLYSLGASQYSGSGPSVFHDVVTGDNSVPGVAGYACGPGYDLATGLGSVDASALVSNWSSVPSTPDFEIFVSPASRTVAGGFVGDALVSGFPAGSFNSPVALTVSGVPDGVKAKLTPAYLSPIGSASSALTLLVSPRVAPGSYPLTITGSSGDLVRTADFLLIVPGG